MRQSVHASLHPAFHSYVPVTHSANSPSAVPRISASGTKGHRCRLAGNEMDMLKFERRVPLSVDQRCVSVYARIRY